MIRRRLPKDIYSRCVTFLYGTVGEVNRHMKKLHPTEWDALHVQHDGHWCVRESQGYESDYIILINKPRHGTKRELTARLHGILVHETFHCASHILRHAGIEHTPATEEAYTYYQQMLFQACARYIP